MENSRNSSANKNDMDRKGGMKNTKFKKRVCRFCQEGVNTLDYKLPEQYIRFVSNKGKIMPRRLSGSCAKHQRTIANTIKRARAAGLMPYIAL